METKELYNGYRIPVIGMGTYNLKENTYSVLSKFTEMGNVLIDCSDNYNNEEVIGETLNKLKSEGISDKEIVYISKFSNPRKTNYVSKIFDTSKEKLCVERINIYLLHWPYPFLWKKQWKQMEKLYEEGKVDAIGVCNFDLKRMKRLMKFCKVKPAINQYECHPLFSQKELGEYCETNNIQVMSYSPLARCDKELYESKVIKDIAEIYHKSVTQVILRWNYQHGFIPIPATNNVTHLEENLTIFDFSLTEEEMMKIDSLECGKRIRMSLWNRFSLLSRIKLFAFSIMAIVGILK